MMMMIQYGDLPFYKPVVPYFIMFIGAAPRMSVSEVYIEN